MFYIAFSNEDIDTGKRFFGVEVIDTREEYEALLAWERKTPSPLCIHSHGYAYN
jgi:hypothetical protein